MNYLIFDTEQTYNYGYIVVNERGDILLRENLVLTNNFENRKLIGENTYKRKKPIYEKDPYAQFVTSADGAKILADRMKKYAINQIISHNVSEDRRQLELLHTQTGIDFPDIPFYDSINLVKVLFPNNTQTGLEAIVSDITGIDVKQTHTALADCELLLTLISPIIEHLPYFIKYQDIFAHDADYEITEKFFSNLNAILPLPKNVKVVQSILGMDDARGDKTKVNNFLKKASLDYHFWDMFECVEYSEKTGKALKTPGLEMRTGANFQDAVAIGALFTSLDKIGEAICSACVAYQATQETDEMLVEKLNIYKTTFDTEFAAREAAFAKYCADREAEFAARETAIRNTVATALMNKIAPVVNGGLFNSESRTVKNLVKANDTQGLSNYFMS